MPEVIRTEHGTATVSQSWTTWWGEFRVLESLTVHAHARQRGEGSKLLTEVCQYADTFGITLLLNVQPLDGWMTRAQLADWYKRHKFEVFDPMHPWWLRRVPHGPQ